MTNLEALKKFANATNNELFDADYGDGEWMVDAVETHETIGSFIESSNLWAEKSTNMESGEIAGFKFVSWNKVQVRKGDQRRSLSVIDFGDIRFALETNLSNFV